MKLISKILIIIIEKKNKLITTSQKTEILGTMMRGDFLDEEFLYYSLSFNNFLSIIRECCLFVCLALYQ
jgi:hypothetical protein